PSSPPFVPPTCGLTSSSLEGLGDLVVHRLGKERECRAGQRLDERFDWHAGDERESTEPCQLTVGNLDAYRIVAFVLLLLLGDVGADSNDLAIELGGRALVEGRKSQHGTLTQMNLIDVVGQNLGLNYEIVAIWHD